MSWQQPSITQQASITAQPAAGGGLPIASPRSKSSSFDLRILAGAIVLGLGLGLFALGIYHGFQNGTCSTTGYAGNYGPVAHCGKGIGWYMLMVMGGLVVIAAGAVLARVLALAIPVLFVTIGAPFIALGLEHGNAQLMANASPATGRVYSLLFGAGFILGGVIWGVFAARSAYSRLDGGAILPRLIGGGVGVAVAFVIAGSVAHAIGTTTASRSGGARSSAAARSTAAAVKHASKAVSQAESQAQTAAKLAACVTAAGSNTSKISACVSRYTP